jgi:hypothetical protein
VTWKSKDKGSARAKTGSKTVVVVTIDPCASSLEMRRIFELGYTLTSRSYRVAHGSVTVHGSSQLQYVNIVLDSVLQPSKIPIAYLVHLT